MRWEYDQSLALHEDLLARKQKAMRDHEEGLRVIEESLQKIEDQIVLAQQQTVNIDAAVLSINNNLIDIGIADFQIKKHNEHLYRLERTSQGAESFKNLSEGERMVISLLYFCELCTGKSSANDVSRPRVAVFDDPVSSMSHVYVFNVGGILTSRFFKESSIAQVFVFTHSLYFFYELTCRNKEERDQTQALFRVTKGAGGSSISAMRYEEIQNDYQAYWQLINDQGQHPAVVANCMRNVLEYFFGFVEKQSFANVFQKPELKQNRFHAFCRYMNRESHSFGQNVFDFKEFDYDSFREGLKLVFELTGYPLHYRKMAKIGR
jgi:wobble nucleotide-excising tRNase